MSRLYTIILIAIFQDDPDPLVLWLPYTLYGQVGHLSHVTQIIFKHIGSTFLLIFIYDLALIYQAVSEIFENGKWVKRWTDHGYPIRPPC